MHHAPWLSLGERYPDRQRLLTQLGDLAAELGCGAWLVGGAVRDLLLGRDWEDLDVTVGGDAQYLGREAARRWGGTLEVKHGFGTATWTLPGGAQVDLAGARQELYPGIAALPQVSPAGLEEDLARRDFTVNALALALVPQGRGELVDQHGGLMDLESRLLRTLHPYSFFDDPTRILRGARFAARLEFELEPGTRSHWLGALEFGVLDRLGRERLGQELDRVLLEREHLVALRLLHELGVLRAISDELRYDAAMELRLEAVAGDPEAMWLALGWELSDAARLATRRLVNHRKGLERLWVVELRRLHRLVGEPLEEPVQRARAMKELSPVALRCLRAWGGSLARAAQWWEDEGQHRRSAVDGASLIAQGGQPGPRLGQALNAAQEAAWRGEDAAQQLQAAMAVLQG